MDSGSSRHYEATRLVQAAAQRLGIHLSALVAETGLWAHPEVHSRLRETGESVAYYPNVRRARVGSGERRGQLVDQVMLDDNSYANRAIKQAIGLHRSHVVGFETCHIWARTCYDERYHTAIANLVLLPRSLAALSDHDEEIQQALQYRAFELYGWHPSEHPAPKRPTYYPKTWREPEPFTDEVQRDLERRFGALAAKDVEVRSHQSKASAGSTDRHQIMSEEESSSVIRRIRSWAGKPRSNVHRIIGLVVRSEGGIPRRRLESEIAEVIGSRDPYGAIMSLKTSKGNAYGQVFQETNGFITLHPAVADEVGRHVWQCSSLDERSS